LSSCLSGYDQIEELCTQIIAEKDPEKMVLLAKRLDAVFVEREQKIVLLRGTRCDLITHSWLLYTTLVTLAIVAWYQITVENDENSDD
jgi:hypothetical protein